MNLSEQSNMFTETSLGENVGGIREELSANDLDLDVGKLCVSLSPTPYQSSCMAADGSSLSTVESDVSGADLLSAFNSICVEECLEPRDDVAPDIKADAFDSVGQADLSTQQPDEAKETSNFDSSDLAIIAEPSAQGDGEAEVLVGIDRTCTQSHSLIVYTSSRRRSARNTKTNQNNKSQKSSKCRGIANKNSVFDLSSLKILRRSRSSFATRARSSVWGNLGNILPDITENLNLGNEKKRRRGRGGKGEKKAIRGQTGQRSTGKRCTPIGHISLKVKIGNKTCSVGNAIEDFSTPEKDIPKLSDTSENKFVEKVPGDVISPCERNLEKVMSSDASVLSTHREVRGTFDNEPFDTSSDFHKIKSMEEGDNFGGSTEIRCSDAGTSPDSEVVNFVPDALLCEKALRDLQDIRIVSEACVSPTDLSNLILSPKHSKKGKKKGELHQVDNCMLESKLTGLETRNDAKAPVSTQDFSSLSPPQTKSKKGMKKDKLCKVDDSSVESNLTGALTKNNANAAPDLGEVQKVGDVSYCSYASMSRTAKPYPNGAETKPCSGLVAASVSTNSQACDGLIPCSNGRKFPKCSRAKGGSKGGSRTLPSEKDKASRKKGNKNNVNGRHLVNGKVVASGDLNGVESFLQAGNLGGTGSLSNALSGPIDSPQYSSDGVREQYDPPKNAWVLCDECQKWRRIPATLADKIEETNCGWTCRDNTDKDFADCSIPQEKSNSEINEELEISDASCEEDAYGSLLKSNQDRSKAVQQSSWTLIKSNLFLNRSQKTQTIDEVMVCHCKPPSDGRMGCGSKCLNRMLNIECVQGTCPCGELCSNQQFQRRNYAKLKWIRCGKKGYGLQALEDISKGQFLIEYVGEVLDVHAYEARQREYALDGHKHFYFMTLNGSEVIDACAKGNLGRFINHSCDPNCRTEKWMVNGEVCIGLFSLTDIKKGEEVTFDYNYVRVFGAAAKKCVCGSPNCRGYIGGDLTNSEVIAQDDSDDEYSEPIMICEDGEMSEEWNKIMSNTVNDGENEIVNEPPQNIYSMKKLISAVDDSITSSNTSETSTQKIEGANSDVCNSAGNISAANIAEKLNIITGVSLKGSTPAALKVESEGLHSQMHSSSQLMDNSSGDIVNRAISSAHELVISVSPSKLLSDTVEHKRKLKYATAGGRDELQKSNTLAKTNRSLSLIKKGKPKTNILNNKESPDVDKLTAVLHKPKKPPELSLNSHFEAVEEKLNELLDPEGGISKRKDASRGYLKLLFLTAATGNNGHGEAIQSNRDLSMILDALLKTKSRTVLVDIINKNGLQMLHNIMKRYRKEFIKTPILRKLLKVLEYLATREILTLEHITGGPPCPGVESFKDSILTLTEHADKQVHQIARNFRDRWIPRSLRKNCCMERDDGRSEFHQPSIHGGLLVSCNQWSDSGGKPSEVMNSFETQSVAASEIAETSNLDHSASGSSYGTTEPKTRKRKSRWDNPVAYPHSRSRTNLMGNEKLNIDEDIPPGFSSPCNGYIVPSDASSTATNHQEKEMQIKQQPLDIISGDPQLRFAARLPVSYGVPYSVMQRFGVQAETSECWSIAPGVQFHPFPPLPPCAPAEVDRSTSTARCATLSEPIEKAGQCSDTCVTYQTDQQHAKTCSMDLPGKNVSVSNDRPDFQQGGSYSLGRKYFRQQKWNHSKLAPPWVRMRNGWGYPGNNPRNGLPE